MIILIFNLNLKITRKLGFYVNTRKGGIVSSSKFHKNVFLIRPAREIGERNKLKISEDFNFLPTQKILTG